MSVHLFDPFWRFEKASFCGPVLRIIFSVCYYFVRFDVRIFVEIGFQRSKNPWGCRTELVLKRVFFAVCPLRAQIWRAGGARRCRFFFSWILGPCQNGLATAVRRVVPCFPVFFDPVFENLKWSSSHPPLFLWVFFLFCSHSSWDWGQRRIAHMFLGSWPSTLLIFWGFLGSS